MNKIKLTATVLVPILVILLAGLNGYFNGAAAKEGCNISVIMENSDEENWDILKQGIESAAKEYQAEVNFISLSDYTGIDEYVEAVRREIADGSDGLVMNLENNQRLVVRLDEILSQEQIVLLETEIPLSKGYTYIAPDNYQMGYDLGLKMKQELAGDEKIGIIRGNTENLSNMDRIRGIQDALADNTAGFVTFDNTTSGYEARMKQSGLKVFVTPDTAITEAALDLLAGEEGAVLYGSGNSEKLVYYLDKGVISWLAVPNEYIMGYLGVRAMHDRLNYVPGEDNIRVDYILVNQSTLHDPENEKLMFPIVQ